MKIVQLPDVLHEYLTELIQNHSARGIHPEEGLAINRLWEAVTRATHVPDADIQKMAYAATPPAQSPVIQTEPAPAEYVLNLGSKEAASHQTGKTIVVECQDCYDNEGSTACIRPAHQAKK